MAGILAAMTDPVLSALADLEHAVVPCDPDLADTAAFCEAYGYAPEDSANAILVIGKSAERPMVCCVVLATTRLDVNTAVRKRLGTRRASFAGAEETIERSGGMQIGGVTPFGLPDDIPVWVDAAVLGRERVIVGGGSRDRKILCPPSSIVALPTADVVEGLARADVGPPSPKGRDLLNADDGRSGHLVSTVIVATPTSRPGSTASVLKVSLSRGAATSEMATLVPVRMAWSPSAFSGSRVRPSRLNR
jgi:prolyl-tRNA editing enzyme YbaK/EbsC (Cys-tRNA(Pro) deacylase)